MSLGESANRPMDLAVNAAIGDGVIVVAAAGNSDADACNYSPAQVEFAITVGATDNSDTSASFTNYGTCVDVFAPGVDILSTWIDSENCEADNTCNTNTNTISGTSMACPHVVGAVARYMSSVTTAPTPAACQNWVRTQATQDAINFRAGHGTSPNRLLYVDGLCASTTM